MDAQHLPDMTMTYNYNPETLKKIAETPLMSQYVEMKKKHPDALLLFRVGDFYETFSDDAVAASEILGITLTRRANGKAAYVELAGFPHHAQCPSFFQGKRDIVHRMKDPAAYLKVFFQMIYFKQCHLLFLLLCIDTFHKVPRRHFRQYGITAFTLFHTF